MVKSKTARRGVELIEKAIAEITANGGKLPSNRTIESPKKTKPAPLDEAIVAQLALADGSPLPPSLRRWLAFDSKWLPLAIDEKKKRLRAMTFSELLDGVPVTVGPFRITPHAVRHTVPAFGVRVEADGAVLAYSGDTDSCPGLRPLLADADLALVEASYLEGRDTTRGVHLTARRAAEAAAAASEA